LIEVCWYGGTDKEATDCDVIDDGGASGVVDRWKNYSMLEAGGD